MIFGTRLASLVFAALTATAAATGCTMDSGDSLTDPGKSDGAAAVLDLTSAERDLLVEKAATCPFMRTAVKSEAIRVRGSIEKPLGDTADVVALGNAGGGDLGKVLEFFAKINHNRLNGPAGTTTDAVPLNTFAIWFPGSRGAHPGHSGILLGDPTDVDSGRLAADRLAKLTTGFSSLHADGKRYISREQIGAFIAENVASDPDSRGINFDALKSLSVLMVELVQRTLSNDPNLLDDTLHLLLTNNDLVNSSGEFALLFTRFADATDADGNPLISTSAVESLFRDGVFPAGWDRRPAKAHDWVKNTIAITISSIANSFGF